MIMGLINYPELGDTDIEKELNFFAKTQDHLVICRIFVFNYAFEISPPPSRPSDPASLVIFPPDGECEGGSMVRLAQSCD